VYSYLPDAHEVYQNIKYEVPASDNFYYFSVLKITLISVSFLL